MNKLIKTFRPKIGFAFEEVIYEPFSRCTDDQISLGLKQLILLGILGSCRPLRNIFLATIND